MNNHKDTAINQLDNNTYDFFTPEFEMCINLLQGSK